MNKLFKVIVMAAVLFISGQSMAQTRGNMFVGASFPTKSYAAFDGLNDFALMSTNEEDVNAGAAIGFNAGLKWCFNVGVKGLDVMLSLDGIYNGPNSDLKEAYRDMESSYNGQILEGSFSYKSTPKFINVPAMLGLNYIYRLNPNLGVYVEAGAGGNLRFITEMESVSKTSILGVETQTTTIQNYDKAFSFAYQAGFGVEVAKNLVIGCSFYDLGSARVNGEQTIKTRTNDNAANTTKDYQNLGTVHPVMFLARIGFCF